LLSYHKQPFSDKLWQKHKIELVYGSANVGLMGAVADGVLNGGGIVMALFPIFKIKIAHNGLTELIVVDSMHERKTKMNDLCDGVITLPGALELLKSF
jgi:predicted Rossmann-fold nucleotide-binding protein